MTYLLTGATGFIGTRLTELLLADGNAVHYLGRSRSTRLDSRAAFQPWEKPETTVAPFDSIPRCDAVIHLAGEPIAQRWTDAAKKRIADSRVLITRNLVSGIAACQHKPWVLVSSSAVGYYGDRADELLTETSRSGSGFLADLCTAWEREADKAADAGVRVVKIRTGVVLAREGGALAKMLPTFRIGIGGTFGSGKQWMSWIHRDDLVKMFRWAAENEFVRGALNGTAPEPVTNREFTRQLAEALHRPAFLPVPKVVLRAVLGEMSEFLFDSIRAIPAAAESHGFSFEYPQLLGALSHELSSHGATVSL